MTTITKERLQEIAEDGFLRHGESKVMARMLLSVMDADPIAWDYEWASCITCEGPQDFKRVIEREAPPEWAIDEGQARNIILLYRHAQPALIAPDIDTLTLNAARDAMSEINRLNELPGGKVQLLAKIQCIIHDTCRAAMLRGGS